MEGIAILTTSMKQVDGKMTYRLLRSVHPWTKDHSSQIFPERISNLTISPLFSECIIDDYVMLCMDNLFL